MAQFGFKKDYYRARTPIKMRKLGDGILIAGPILQTAIMSLPLTDLQKTWINFGITIITLIGKLITNFFTEDPIPGDITMSPEPEAPKEV